MTNIDKITRKIEALLNQAADREGTPEGDVFRSKAFDLMARYGVEQSQLNPGEQNPMEDRVFNLTGSYTDMQGELLNGIATALHCKAIFHQRYRSSVVESVHVFGRRSHLERVNLLFSILNPHMIAGANNYSASLEADIFTSTVRQKRSFMAGFRHSIQARLMEMERAYEDGYTNEGKSGSLVLLDDLARAKQLMAEHYAETVERKTNRRYSADGVNQGQTAGKNMDLGQQRFAGRAAISA